MREELLASLEGLLQDYNRQVDELQDMQRKMQDISATTTTKDRLVTVVVGPRGQVQDLRLDTRVYTKYKPPELSRTIMRLIGEATEEVSARLEELMKPFMPEGLPFADLFGEGADFTTFLPKPVMEAEEDRP